jgi:TatD DNase family protein
MSYIDTHSHLYPEYYPLNFDEVVKRAITANVTKILLPCVSSETINDLFYASENYPDNLFPMIGLHPTDVNENYLNELSALKQNLQNKSVVAVGEIGIDLYHDSTFLDYQIIAFKTQIQWALDLQLPMSIHVRDGFTEAFKVLKQFSNQPLKGVFHCFSGGIQEAKWLIERGFYLGITGVITFKKSKLPELVKEIGIDHLVLETDAPFLAPEPFRGKQNESSYIPLIGKKLAEIFEITEAHVMEITTRNAEQLFTKIV